MSSTLLSRRDVQFLLYEWLNVEELTKNPRFAEHSRETFDAALELSETLAAREFRPHNRTSDLNEPHFDGRTVHIIPEVAQALTAFAETGLLAGTMDEDLGGIQLPHVVHRACFAWFQAANIATCGYPMLTMANANLLRAYGTDEQIRRFVTPMLDGRFFGTMCLSEPHAGSSLSDLTTRAAPDGPGRYRIFGRKMWISGGDHELSENIVHLVLARTQGARPGVKGLSLFVVPKYLVAEDGTLGERNDVTLAGLNHKMGYRGTTNTMLNFGEGVFSPDGGPGAIGYLVGQENRGLDYMFHMMNEARIGVGAGAAALGYTGYLEALEYARTRPQGRPTGHKDPTSPQVSIVEHPDVRRMLLASKAYAEGSMALVLYAAKLLDESTTAEDGVIRADAERLLDVLTPIVKSWPSQWCLVANDLAIQIHGGAGYTRDHNVEQIYRDNRLNPIHEGTHGIHGLDLLGRKMVIDDRAGLELLTRTIRDTVHRAPAELAPWAQQLSDRLDRLAEVTALLWWDNHPETALANATVYLEAAGHVVLAWIWLDQAIAAHGRDGAFYDGKRAAARYFFTYELPKVDAQFDLLSTRDMQLVELDPACL
ncbi:acyl-CoA dehydrogenase [Rhodococcus sp. NPDC057529]|uniref:acyl-CoA dehydrogenase n=1 Tax=Rhodococcus sp. NPDC057529 TaxID=3346158 RepID=UPI003672848E